ncbi:GGDEF domain-containing protein [Desulfurispira natronophila]|uniref:diguanylate cyclase n=1 Tax=Desulfurispira natronophila TaxID=682562 RepID=A0A7W7Y2T5_9BACT|nr:GGDEF domain-containing protein [Desulfurispira natronophila]MBB5021041.1 hemerythrin [Desulfurispira natronophila]
MIEVFSWKESFLTNIASVDEQHQKLVELINELSSIATSREGRVAAETYAKSLSNLLEYTSSHFADEEQLMNKHKLHKLFIEEHAHEHKLFKKEIISLSKITGNTVSTEQSSELLNYLVNWLAYHILGIDQSMARQIKAIQSGSAPTAALERERWNQRGDTEPLLDALKGLFTLVSERNRELRDINQTLEERVKQRTDELEYANKQLRYLAENDELTGLPNRRFGMQSLELLWEHYIQLEVPLSVLLIDADKFKQVNDRFGHAEGDNVLRALATNLRHNVRTSDIVCRLGGDEFLVICPRTHASGAIELATKILSNRVMLCNKEGLECWDGSISVGIATPSDDMQSIEDLLKKADQALYKAKRLGGCQYATM